MTEDCYRETLRPYKYLCRNPKFGDLPLYFIPNIYPIVLGSVRAQPFAVSVHHHLETFGQIPCAVPQGGFALGRPARSWGTTTLSPASRTLPRGRAMSGFPRVQKHPLLRGGIKGGGRLKRVNFAPHGTLVHRRRVP